MTVGFLTDFQLTENLSYEHNLVVFVKMKIVSLAICLSPFRSNPNLSIRLVIQSRLLSL